MGRRRGPPDEARQALGQRYRLQLILFHQRSQVDHGGVRFAPDQGPHIRRRIQSRPAGGCHPHSPDGQHREAPHHRRDIRHRQLRRRYREGPRREGRSRGEPREDRHNHRGAGGAGLEAGQGASGCPEVSGRPGRAGARQGPVRPQEAADRDRQEEVRVRSARPSPGEDRRRERGGHPHPRRDRGEGPADPREGGGDSIARRPRIHGVEAEDRGCEDRARDAQERCREGAAGQGGAGDLQAVLRGFHSLQSRPGVRPPSEGRRSRMRPGLP